MQFLQELILKLMQPEILKAIVGGILVAFYLIGRITKGQFYAEQLKAQGLIDKLSARPVAAEKSLGLLGDVLNVLDQIPVLNLKLPVVNESVPGTIKLILSKPMEIVSDIVFHFPFFGTKAS